MKNGNESWDVLGDSRKRYRGPTEKGKYWPGKEPIRFQDSLPCALKKKIIFFQFFKIRKKNQNSKNSLILEKWNTARSLYASLMAPYTGKAKSYQTIWFLYEISSRSTSSCSSFLIIILLRHFFLSGQRNGKKYATASCAQEQGTECRAMKTSTLNDPHFDFPVFRAWFSQINKCFRCFLFSYKPCAKDMAVGSIFNN